jgi:hypothetical protein
MAKQRAGTCDQVAAGVQSCFGPPSVDLATLQARAWMLGSSKRVFPEPFLSRSYCLKRQTSKYSNACEPWLKPQATVWCGLAHPIWPNRREPSQAKPSRAVTSLGTALRLCLLRGQSTVDFLRG